MKSTKANTIGLIMLLLGVFSHMALAKEYRNYEPDWTPFQKHKKSFERWQELTAIYVKNGLSQKLLEEKNDLLAPIISQNPDWVDGHWILANNYMQMGEILASGDTESAQRVRGYLVKAKESSEQCLELKKDQPICKFFLGAAIGKIATIDGIISSLGKGKQVLDLWKEVYASDTEYVFDGRYSLQGLVRYGLGIFYRVVPDVFLLRWFFGYSGDIDKSIAMHEEALTFVGGKEACSQLMYAISMLCKSGGDKNQAITSKAFTVLDNVSQLNPGSESSQVCVRDSIKIKHNPGNACGYTKAKQHDVDEQTMSAKLKTRQ